MARQKSVRQYPATGKEVFMSQILDWYKEEEMQAPGADSSDGRGGEGVDYNDVPEGN